MSYKFRDLKEMRDGRDGMREDQMSRARQGDKIRLDELLRGKIRNLYLRFDEPG